MKPSLVTFLFGLNCMLALNGFGQENSVLSGGEWYQIAVEQTDVYKIDRSLLSDLGLDPSSIDPRNIAIYGYGGGMLPQENAEERTVDLPENAIMVVGEEDGQFNNDDYILFYGQSPDRLGYNSDGELTYEKNLYSDESYYFLTIKNQPGKRIASIINEGDGFPTINTFNDVFVYEEDLINLIEGGREWYGQVFTSNQNTFEITVPASGLVSSSEIKVTSNVMAQAFGSTSFDIQINGIQLGNQVLGSIPDAVYDIKGVDDKALFTTAVNSIGPTSTELTLAYRYNATASGVPKGFINYSIVETEKLLNTTTGTLQFRSITSLENSFSTYQIQGNANQTLIWDVTDPQNVQSQEFASNETTITFGSFSTTLKEFVIISGEDLESPIIVGNVPNQNIRGVSDVDGIIITHENFLSEANRLATFRSTHDRLDVQVVTTSQVYNEFSSGRQDISAIRDFIRHIFMKDSRLKYVLLFGDASYDYKERTIGQNTNYVPIYEARNSLHPIFSYSSDDYFGFMDEDEGFWEETEAGDHQLDIGIGRLPVKSPEEAETLVDKLIEYSTEASSIGNWRNEVYFIADDGDFNIHQRDADELARFVDGNFSAFNPNKIYLDAFPQTTTPNGETAEGVTKAINDAIEKGSLVFNFTGHGNENLWCEEGILDQNNIRQWSNRTKLPLFVTATCEFGKYDNPNITSGGELLLLSKIGGAIGVLTTSRPVFSNTNFALNRAFYNNVFKKGEDGQFPRLGDIIRSTKNESTRGPVNRNFALLGDPMLMLAYPTYQIEITDLNGRELSVEGDTISALGLTKFGGRIIDSKGDLSNDFNGILSIKVFDTPSEFITLGNESNPTTFSQRKSVIFRGDVSITGGLFEFEFVVPKNITYLFQEAKISLYGKSDNLTDANGANINLKIGGSNSDQLTDQTPPDIQLFLNDDTFQSGDKVGKSPLLVSKFFDENGINITDSGIGQNISLRIDDQEEINLNDFYSADLDSYQSGTLRYPLEDLEEGKHTAEIRVFDTFNNSATKSIDFLVTRNAKSTISNVTSYPNPVRDRTTFLISHNNLGENIEVSIEIYSLNGDLTQTIKTELFDNTGTIDQLEWDRTNMQGSRVNEGIYISKIILKTNDGAGSAHHKLIVID